jgi:hypothetical protein
VIAKAINTKVDTCAIGCYNRDASRGTVTDCKTCFRYTKRSISGVVTKVVHIVSYSLKVSLIVVAVNVAGPEAGFEAVSVAGPEAGFEADNAAGAADCIDCTYWPLRYVWALRVVGPIISNVQAIPAASKKVVPGMKSDPEVLTT